MIGRLRALPRPLVLGAVPIAVLLMVAVVSRGPDAPPQRPIVDSVPQLRLIARGQIRPAVLARVATLGGGVMARLGVESGEVVETQQEIARVRGPSGMEVLTAPWRGTIVEVPVQIGDTVMPGTAVAMVADLSRLQVETTDVDEFLVGRLRKGQIVTVTVEALDRRELRGTVRTVAIQPQTTRAGDEHYPVVIDLLAGTPELRPGLTARVVFPEQ